MIFIPIVKNQQEAHIARKDNPHTVMKAQVGLGNVDNISDADKPISTAVQTALNGKVNTSHTHAAADITPDSSYRKEEYLIKGVYKSLSDLHL